MSPNSCANTYQLYTKVRVPKITKPLFLSFFNGKVNAKSVLSALHRMHKTRPTVFEKIFANHISDKGRTPKIHM